MSEEKDLTKEQENIATENAEAKVEAKAEETTAQDAEVIEEEVKAEVETEVEEEKVQEPAPEPKTVIIEENVDFKDKYYRLSAEFDNYRKRTLKEKMDYMKNASGDILGKLLPIMDNFERALKSLETATEVAATKEGVDLIYGNFTDLMKQSGVKEIDAQGKDFDVDLHEALTKIPAPSEDLKGKVVDVIEKGYKLNDKVIRYAKVVIGE